MKFSYSYSYTIKSPSPAPEKLAEYSYNEFLLDLPTHWRQVPTSEDNTFNFQSDTEGAAIIISADFYDIPSTKAQAIAEKCIESRLEAHSQQFPDQVEVIQSGIKPHSGGIGLEMNYAAEVPGKHVFIYLGYVTSRKILNFTLVCRPDRMAAAALFNNTIAHFRAKLP